MTQKEVNCSYSYDLRGCVMCRHPDRHSAEWKLVQLCGEVCGRCQYDDGCVAGYDGLPDCPYRKSPVSNRLPEAKHRQGDTTR